MSAFDHGVWPRLHPRARGEILQHFADLIEEHRGEIALLISLEMGKPIRDAYQIELRALIRCLRFYGELADKESGEITPDRGGRAVAGHPRTGRRRRRGRAVELPADARRMEAGARTGRRLHRGAEDRRAVAAVDAAGGRAWEPWQVCRRVSSMCSAGTAQVVGRHLGEHPDVDVLTFTGSTEVGRHFMRYSADSNLKRVYLELGGKSPNIIFPDAPDLDAAADAAAWAIYLQLRRDVYRRLPAGGSR